MFGLWRSFDVGKVSIKISKVVIVIFTTNGIRITNKYNSSIMLGACTVITQ